MRDSKPCIFCGRHGSKSKEHFYPAWLAEYIDGGGVHNTDTVLSQRGYSPRVVTAGSTRQGHLITKKLRVVCQTCNSVWMSQIENAVKPMLVAGLTGGELQLSQQHQRLLATWVCLKAIVSEHANSSLASSSLASTPFVDRSAFYEQRLIPSYFRIYLGVHSTASVTWLYRHSCTIAFRKAVDPLSKSIDPPLLDGLQRNTQTVTFILGRFLFHVLAARVAQFGLDTDLTYPGLTRLWPLDKPDFNTSSVRILNAPQLKEVVTSFEAYLLRQKPTLVDAVI